MKIGIMGSHYVGKTIMCRKLCEYLKEKGHDARVVGEIAGICPFPINEKSTFEAQLWIQLEQMRQEIEHQNEKNIVITDRTVLDNFAYLYRLWKHKQVGDTEMLAVKNMVSMWIKTYDIIFLLYPFETDRIEDDGIRSTDDSFRQEVHGIIIDMIKEFDVKPVVIKDGEDGTLRKIIEKIGK